MRTAVDVENFAADAARSVDDPKRLQLLTDAYEACVPRDFWEWREEDVTHNVEAFRGSIAKYVRHLGTARRHGYGLLLLGENGTGKSVFLSWVLMAALRAGYSAFYSSMLQLDHDIRRGFGDPKFQARLDEMLRADFLAIDELGKEKFKEGDSFTRLQVERILKGRFDDRLPTLLASNMDAEELEETYGRTIGSILTGKYQSVPLEPGDFRARLAEEMRSKMGFE